MRTLVKISVVVLGMLWLATASALAQAPSANWRGWYIGGNLGYGWGEASNIISFSSSRLLSSTGSGVDFRGTVGGGQIGYNFQYGFWLLGVEADIQGVGGKGSAAAVCPGGSATPAGAVNGVCTPGSIGDTVNAPGAPVYATLTQDLQWFGTVRGRAGYVIAPNVTIFGTGGLAFGRVDSTLTLNGINVSGLTGQNVFFFNPVSAAFNESSTKTGYALGGGFEAMLIGNWTGKVEYLYVDLGRVSGTFATALVATGGGPLNIGYNSRITENILRVGVNYRFAP